jgi:hypothetical protein
MFEATGLKLQRRDRLQWQNLPAEFHENLPISSKVISGGVRDTDKEHGELM